MVGTKTIRSGLAIACIAGAVVAGSANAQAGTLKPQNPSATLLDNESIVDDQTLASLHGRDANITYNVDGKSTLNSSINGASVSAGGDILSGSVGLSGNAMQNFSGLSNFVATTGNNNNLQASMSVNILLH